MRGEVGTDVLASAPNARARVRARMRAYAPEMSRRTRLVAPEDVQ